MVLLAVNENLQYLLGIMSDWCYKWRLKVNKNKTEIIHFRTVRKAPTNVVFEYGNDDLEVVSRYKYLGIILDEHLKFDICSKSLAESGGRASGSVKSKFRNLKNTGYSTFKKMFDMAVKSILEYAGGVWGYIKSKDIEMIQSRAMRYYLGVHRFAPIAGMYGDMGWMKPYMGRYICMIRFWNRLINMDNSRLTKQIFNWDYECKTGWSKEIENVFTQLNLDEYFIHKRVCSLDSALNQIQIFSSEKRVEELASKPKLRTYVTYKTEFGLESYISSNMSRQRRSLMAQFRLGILPITVETGRFRNIPLQDRKCTICDLNEVEDEKHFLCICPVYNDIRSTLYTKVNTINSEFSTLNMSERFVFLMKYVWRDVSNFILTAWNKRKSILYN